MVNWGAVFLVTGIAVPVIVLLYWFITSRKGTARRGSGAVFSLSSGKDKHGYGLLPEGSGDLLVLLVDDTTRTIVPTWASRLSGNLYMLEQGGEIRYLVVLPYTKVYDLGGVKTVLAYGYSSIVMPIDPSLVSSLKLLKHTEQLGEDMARIKPDDLKSLLAFLMKNEEKTEGSVVIPGYGKVGFSFDIDKIITNTLHELLYQPVVTIRRFFGTMEEIDRIRELIKSRIELEKVKAGKFSAIGYMIFIILLGVGIALAIMFSMHIVP